MFTAIVLVCLAGEAPNPESCYTYTNQVISESIQECQYDVMTGIDLKIFEWEEPDLGQRFEVADWYCVNWDGKRV